MDTNGEMALSLRNEITCSICRSYFSQPVTISCGHSFCQACLSETWSSGARSTSCPECRQAPQTNEFPELNICLEKLSDTIKEFNFDQSQCPTHEKVIRLFCEEDQTLLCVLCCQSPEHGGHTLLPVEEAVLKYRKMFQEILNDAGKDLEEAKKLTVARSPFINWHAMISMEYDKLQNILTHGKSLSLQRFQEEKKANMDIISQHIKALQEIMQELHQSCPRSKDRSTTELLVKNIEKLSVRSDSVLSQRPKDIIPELEEYPITGMIDFLNKFRVDIQVKPNPFCSYVTVSEDLKSMQVKEDWKMEPDHLEYCRNHHVFAEQVFMTGRHYWEVDVTQVFQWSLGVRIRISPASGRKKRASEYLLYCLKKEDNFYFRSFPSSLRCKVKDFVPRIGVYLDCYNSTLLFYNVLKQSPIYKFSSIPWGTVRPIFCPGPELSGTKPGPMIICPRDSHLCHRCYSPV